MLVSSKQTFSCVGIKKESWFFTYDSLGVPRPVKYVSKAHDYLAGVYRFTIPDLILVELQGISIERKRFIICYLSSFFFFRYVVFLVVISFASKTLV